MNTNTSTSTTPVVDPHKFARLLARVCYATTAVVKWGEHNATDERGGALTLRKNGRRTTDAAILARGVDPDYTFTVDDLARAVACSQALTLRSAGVVGDDAPVFLQETSARLVSRDGRSVHLAMLDDVRKDAAAVRGEADAADAARYRALVGKAGAVGLLNVEAGSLRPDAAK